MKKVIALTAALTLAAPAVATAQSQVQPLNQTTSSQGSLALLGLGGAATAAVVIVVAAAVAAAASNGT